MEWGKGHITKKGYRRVRYNGRMQMEHRLVWIKYNGEIPPGYQIHHIDGDKLNNSIENLQMVSALAHKRLHSGCKFVDGKWYKPCIQCRESKEIEEHYYKQEKWIMSYCKKCAIENAVRNKRLRKQRKLIDKNCTIEQDGNAT